MRLKQESTPRYSSFWSSPGKIGSEFFDRQVQELGTRGIRSLAIARQDNEDGRWRFLGILTFLDPPFPDTKYAIEEARGVGLEVRPRPTFVRCIHFGVVGTEPRQKQVKMITGDQKLIAVETARVLGMGTTIMGPQELPVLADSFSDVLSPIVRLHFRAWAAFVSLLDCRQPVLFESTQVLDADGNIPRNLPENYGARIVPVSGFAQAGFGFGVYSLIQAFSLTVIRFIVQATPEQKYLIVETLRQVHLNHFTCYLPHVCAPRKILQRRKKFSSDCSSEMTRLP
jgi:magnesium-transporting ATPase (P-type)